MIFCLGLYCNTALANEEQLVDGATYFIERCTLCHGNSGMGDGVLPLSVKAYPSTNLLDKKIDLKRARHYLKNSSADRNPYSPPWSEELSVVEINALAEFTALLSQQNETANQYLKTASKKANVEISKAIGGVIYQTRCKICHGKSGDGNGRLSNVIKNPKPSNLSISRLNDTDLAQIIKNGGAQIGRSEAMPPWKNELYDADIQSVILKIKTFRNK